MTVTRLPGGFSLTTEPGGRRIVRRHNTALRIAAISIIVILSVGTVVLLLRSAGEGDAFAGVFCVAAPIVLGPLTFALIRHLLTRHQFVLGANTLIHEWDSFFDGAGSAPVVRLGILRFDNGEGLSHFLAVARSGTSPLTVVPGWSAWLRDLQALGQWIHEQTGVPFQPEPVTSGAASGQSESRPEPGTSG